MSGWARGLDWLGCCNALSPRYALPACVCACSCGTLLLVWLINEVCATPRGSGNLLALACPPPAKACRVYFESHHTLRHCVQPRVCVLAVFVWLLLLQLFEHRSSCASCRCRHSIRWWWQLRM